MTNTDSTLQKIDIIIDEVAKRKEIILKAIEEKNPDINKYIKNPEIHYETNLVNQSFKLQLMRTYTRDKNVFNSVVEQIIFLNDDQRLKDLLKHINTKYKYIRDYLMFKVHNHKIGEKDSREDMNNRYIMATISHAATCLTHDINQLLEYVNEIQQADTNNNSTNTSSPYLKGFICDLEDNQIEKLRKMLIKEKYLHESTTEKDFIAIFRNEVIHETCKIKWIDKAKEKSKSANLRTIWELLLLLMDEDYIPKKELKAKVINKSKINQIIETIFWDEIDNAEFPNVRGGNTEDGPYQLTDRQKLLKEIISEL